MKSAFISLLFALIAMTGQAQNTVNNFKINVKVTQGIEDSGYLVHLFDANQTHRDQIGKITVINKRTAFETHLEEPLVGDLTAIFPDGSICTACVRFPFVPNEQVNVKVKNGTFELSGTTFYQQWADADELEENARKYYKQWETDSIILNYLKKHADEEGCVMRYWQYNILPRQTILSIIPESMKNGRFKHFFDSYHPANADRVQIEEVEPDVVPDSPQDDFEPTPLQRMQIEQKGQLIQLNIEWIKKAYESISEELDGMRYQFIIDMSFKQISSRNKELDKQWQDLIKTVKGFDVPKSKAPELFSDLYKEILKFYANQNEELTIFYKKYGSYTKEARKTQKDVNKLTEKYMKEMKKTLEQLT